MTLQLARSLYTRRYGHESPAFARCYELLQEHVSGRVRVLDAGQGPSRFVREVVGTQPRLVGVDAQWPISHPENGDLPGAANLFLQSRLEQLPFGDANFDVVVCLMVVEHLENPGACFAEFHRVLRPGGRLLMFTTNVLNPIMLVSRILPLHAKQAVIRRFLSFRGDVAVHPTFYRANRPGRVTSLLRAVGFRKITVSLHPGSAYYMAMNRLCFRFGWWWERCTDWLPLQRLRLYLLTVAQRS